MRWTRRLVWSLAVVGGVGCATERQRLVGERASREEHRDSLRAILDSNAPVGSQLASSPDTARLLGEISAEEQRIGEIDRQLNAR